jgi:hypothetical protein
MRLPSALVSGQYRVFTDLLMMTEGRRCVWSSGVNVRPSITGMCIASKYQGVARRSSKAGGSAPAAGGNSSITAAALLKIPVSGSPLTAAARFTPGIASSRPMSRA